jgi:hypothetical protein
VGGRDGQLGLRLGREMPAAVAQYRHSRRWDRGEGEKVERTARQRLIWVLGEKKGAVCRHSWCAKLGCPMSVRLPGVAGCTTATRWSSLAGHWAATAMHPLHSTDTPDTRNALLWLSCGASNAQFPPSTATESAPSDSGLAHLDSFVIGSPLP